LSSICREPTLADESVIVRLENDNEKKDAEEGKSTCKLEKQVTVGLVSLKTIASEWNVRDRGEKQVR
jgi:hypothetical protein